MKRSIISRRDLEMPAALFAMKAPDIWIDPMFLACAAAQYRTIRNRELGCASALRAYSRNGIMMVSNAVGARSNMRARQGA
jgi:hypothetical protein